MGQSQHDLADIEACISAELEHRIAEDDANPNGAIAWETIRDEAQARWQYPIRSTQ